MRDEVMTIDQALARGLRRQEMREFDTCFSQLDLMGLPQRFGAMAREIHNRLVNQMGAHRIVKSGTEKKSHSWLTAVTNSRGNEELLALSLRRTSAGPRRDIVPFWIEATPHFIERLIQARRCECPPTVHIMHSTLAKIINCATYENEESVVSWALSGNLTVALPDCLVLGYMPKEGNVELRTVLRVDVLDPDKRKVWEKLSAGTTSYSVRPLQCGLQQPVAHEARLE
jgi:hypothetical protein